MSADSSTLVQERDLGNERGPQGTRSVSVLGGSGYTGGELLRYLMLHPGFEVVAATSRQNAGQPLHRVHPHLRGFTQLSFTKPDELPDADVVVSCLPHKTAAKTVAGLLEQGTRVVDLSADFRLGDPQAYRAWYGQQHPYPDLLSRRVYGLPEAHRDEIPGARLVSGVGCVATATNLALLPLARSGLLADARVVVDAKIGSSAAGAEPSAAGMHAERSRTIRLYAPTSHRHAAEVVQETGAKGLHMSVHAVELVRGVLATCHVLVDETPSTRDLWQAWRASYQDEPFVRVVKERRGVHRGPDPRLVAGTNLADVSFFVEEEEEGRGGGGRIVTTCAIDNLGKGAAGSAVQSLNLMNGHDETQGLMLVPAHPM